MSRVRIAVVGSSNTDLTIQTPRLPNVGETMFGTSFSTGFGGKGANQAVMAAKLGSDVCMVSKVGDDAFGRSTLENYEKLGVRTDHVTVTREAATGVAPIFVTPDGKNSIVVIPGANMCLSEADVSRAADAIRTARALIVQWEVTPAATLCAMRIAHEAGVKVIFNPAPAPDHLDAEFYRLSDFICPNEVEAQQLTGVRVDSVDAAYRAAEELLARGARAVVITLGERGAVYLDGSGQRFHEPAAPAKAVDTAGAGDAFLGAFATLLALNRPVRDAVCGANFVAARSVERPGTQSSYPSRAEVAAALRLDGMA